MTRSPTARSTCIRRLKEVTYRHQSYSIDMTRGVRVLRAWKVARQRRAMSPDYLQVALQSALGKVRGMCKYHWRKKFCERGYPSVSIVIQLRHLYDNTAAADAAVHVLSQDLEDVVSSLSIIVTFCDAAFWPCVSNE
jgi:hypothetical protein